MQAPVRPTMRPTSGSSPARSLRWLGALAGGLLLAQAAQAVDLAKDYGTSYVAHIDVHVGNGRDFPGDQPGYPLTLTKSGTYRLVGDLSAMDLKDAIHVADGANVTIDLNGYSIEGNSTCSRTVLCNALRGSAGVRLLGPQAHARLVNGRIRGFTEAAVSAFNPSGDGGGTLVLQDLMLEGNGAGVLAARAVASRLIVRDNSNRGVWSSVLQLSDSQIERNGRAGVTATLGSVRDTVATGNGGAGFVLGTRVVLHHSVAQGNAGGNLSGGLDVAGTNVAGPERN